MTSARVCGLGNSSLRVPNTGIAKVPRRNIMSVMRLAAREANYRLSASRFGACHINWRRFLPKIASGDAQWAMGVADDWPSSIAAERARGIVDQRLPQ